MNRFIPDRDAIHTFFRSTPVVFICLKQIIADDFCDVRMAIDVCEIFDFARVSIDMIEGEFTREVYCWTRSSCDEYRQNFQNKSHHVFNLRAEENHVCSKRMSN